MSVLFDSYEDELQKALKKARVIMNNFHLTADKEKPNSIKDIKAKIREAEKNKAKMESEYAVAPSQMKAQFKKKVETCFRELDETSKKFNKLESDYIDNTNRENLMKEATKGQNGINNTANLNEQLSAQNQKFGNIHRMAHETQGIVENSNAELLKQREVMLKLKEDNKEIGSGLDRVDNLTKIMRNKDLMNKAILWAVVFLLGVTNLIVLFLKIRRVF